MTRTSGSPGLVLAHRKGREYRLAHPSGPEQRLITLLFSLGLQPGRDYQREYEEPFAEGGPYFLDFAWPEARKAIEVDSGVHQLAYRAGRDRRRRRVLAAAGWEILVVEAQDLPRRREAITVFLGRDPAVKGEGFHD
jgi:hypothetical protein